MNFLKTNGKKILIGVISAIILFVVIKVFLFIYSNSYLTQEYTASVNYLDNQALDQNVKIVKNIKRNGKSGEITLKFDKKEISEEYAVVLDKNIKASSVEFSVEGKVTSGDIRLSFDEPNNAIFDKTLKGNTVKEVTTQNIIGRDFKIHIIPNGAQGGELKIRFDFK